MVRLLLRRLVVFDVIDGNDFIVLFDASSLTTANFPRMKFLLRRLIRGYQLWISPALHALAGPGAGCRYTPTCSQYFIEALDAHGFIKGSGLGLRRIFRCHPWGGHGHDPVPASTNLPKPPPEKPSLKTEN